MCFKVAFVLWKWSLNTPLKKDLVMKAIAHGPTAAYISTLGFLICTPALGATSTPTQISNDSTISLQCGQTYQGSLNLQNKSNVTVTSAGGCGNAIITPGSAITSWKYYKDNIYVASIGFTPTQVSVDGKPMELAHWPNKASPWVSGKGLSTTQIVYQMPSTDLVGATLMFRANRWAIEARTINGYSSNTMTLASTNNPSYDGYSIPDPVQFYVEGKLWMLDSPGEWAVSDGKLYLWAPDGLSPEGRVWASPNTDGINATNTKNIKIDGITVFSSANGINGIGSSKLQILNSQIFNSSENGIIATGSSDLSINNTAITNSKHDAITTKYSGAGISITNSTIQTSGTVGMPTHAHAGINLSGNTGAVISNNVVTDSAYIGIRAYKNAVISYNTVDKACVILSDCGGIYTFARDQTSTNVQITGNTIKNLVQDMSSGIYLDDFANGTTVSKNTIYNNPNGLLIHNGFNNSITYNTFYSNTNSHVKMYEDSKTPSISNNQINNNTFTVNTNTPTYLLTSYLGANQALSFGSYNYNNYYISKSNVFATITGISNYSLAYSSSTDTISYQNWLNMTSQDKNSAAQ